LTNPDRENITKAARAVPLAFSQGAKPVAVGQDETLSEVAYRALRGKPDPDKTDPARLAVVWLQGRLAASIEMLGNERIAVSLVVDDSEEALSQSNSAAWRDWLRWSNAMALRDWPTTVTTCSLIEAGEEGQTMLGSELSADTAGLPTVWATLLASTDSPIERALLKRLAEAGVATLPVLGEEGPDGIPLDICWPAAKVVIEVEPMPPEDRDDLKVAGWKVVEADSEKLLGELALAGVS
jgi:hypothetical protein